MGKIQANLSSLIILLLLFVYIIIRHLCGSSDNSFVNGLYSDQLPWCATELVRVKNLNTDEYCSLMVVIASTSCHGEGRGFQYIITYIASPLHRSLVTCCLELPEGKVIFLEIKKHHIVIKVSNDKHDAYFEFP